jgi:cytochrome b pre-mRNA-processing protein 3
MGLWQRLAGRKAENPAASLYAAIVGVGREPDWYVAGEVPDTVDGRFDMIASVLAIVMLRLESEPTPAAAAASARLTECFVEDMDGQLRQFGVGDVIVGKRVGKIMGLVGGRLAAYRDGLAGAASFDEALVRNLYRGAHPGEAALAHVAARLRALHGELAKVELDALMAGRLSA